MSKRWLGIDPVLAAAAVVILIAGVVLGVGFPAACAALVLVLLPAAAVLWSKFAQEHLNLPPEGTRERTVVLRARRAVRLIGDLTAGGEAAVLPQRGRESRIEALRVVETVETLARQSIGIKRVSLQLAGSPAAGDASAPRAELAEVGGELLERAAALVAGIENVAANIARLVVVHEAGGLPADGGMQRIAGELESLRMALQEAQELGRQAAAMKILEV